MFSGKSYALERKTCSEIPVTPLDSIFRQNPMILNRLTHSWKANHLKTIRLSTETLKLKFWKAQSSARKVTQLSEVPLVGQGISRKI